MLFSQRELPVDLIKFKYLILFWELFLNIAQAKDVSFSGKITDDSSACTINSSLSINSSANINDIDHALKRVEPKLDSRCIPVQNHNLKSLAGGKLSAFWGYDFIGVDLAQEELEPMKVQMFLVKTATSENVNLKEVPEERLSANLIKMAQTQESQPYYGHGTSVANIIYGSSPLGISLKGELTVSSLFTKNGGVNSSAIDDVIANKIKIYQSSETSNSPEAFYKMRELGIISFRSAGNYYPSNENFQEASEVSVIVGQLSPLGGMSADSSAHRNVKIAAPGRVYSYRNGETHIFGGTSGAQPVVTGCFLNVVSLLPDITPDEADAIIQKSAIPTLNSQEKNSNNGQGTVNCFKLAKVASRLKSDWPQNRKKITDDPLLYNFKSDSGNFIEAANKFSDTRNPCDISKKLKLLRKAFLLDPNNKKTLEKLIKIYRDLGYSGNAVLYESMLGFSSVRLKEIYNEFKGTEFEADAVRLIADFYPQAKGIFPIAIMSKDEQTVLLSAHLGKTELTNKQVQENLLRIMKDGKIESMNSSLFLQQYFENYKLSSTDIMKACGEKMPQWEKDEDLSDSITNCMLSLSYDEKEAHHFILKQLKRKSPVFKKNFLDFLTSGINTDNHLLQILSSVENALEWSTEERLQISDLLKNAGKANKSSELN